MRGFIHKQLENREKERHHDSIEEDAAEDGGNGYTQQPHRPRGGT